MTVPGVNTTQVINGLGISPGSTGKMLCIAGPSSGGTAAINTPVALARVTDVKTQFGNTGPLVQFGCYAIEKYGKTVLLMRTAASTAGSAGTNSAGTPVLTDWDGTSGVAASGTPTSSWAWAVQIILGGVFGTGPITLQWSLNGGTSWSANVSLGTALTYLIPGSGITLTFDTGDTCIAADIVTGQASAAMDLTHVTGTSVVTVTGTPNDDTEYGFKVVAPTALAAVVGTGPIHIQTTLDNGRNWGPVVILTTATTYVIPDSGLTLHFATGNLNPGDYATGISTAPVVTSADLGTSTTVGSALRNLYVSAQNWECLLLASTIDSTVGGVLDSFIVALRTTGKGRWWLANTDIPTLSEADAAYQTSLATLSASYATNVAAISAGAARIVSAADTYDYVRPISMAVGPMALSVPEHIRISETDLGLIPGVSITDQNGAPAARCHDEMYFPGLDDLRYLALRSDPTLSGVYVNRPHMFGASNSDFDMIPKIRVWNLAFEALFAFFKARLQKPVLADPTTGFIFELTAKELESSANRALIRATLNKVSAPITGGSQMVAISRTDPLLNTTTPTLTVDARVIPMGYFDFVNLSLGFAVTAVPATPANGLVA